MAFTSVAARTFFEFGEGANVRRLSGEKFLMDIFRREASSAANEDLASLLLPFENRSGADAQFAAHVGGDGDLALRG
jgi:hypothetical protein